jgi:hypothetical protein
MMKNLLIAFVFALMLINPNISIAAESPVDVQEVFVGSETMDGDALKYPKGKAEIRLQWKDQVKLLSEQVPVQPECTHRIRNTYQRQCYRPGTRSQPQRR